jgi:hypothetical protein
MGDLLTWYLRDACMDEPTLAMTGSSLLELAIGGLPFPHGGPDGRCRYRHAVRPDGINP